MDCRKPQHATILIWSLQASFPSLDVFSVFIVARFIRKNVTAVKFSPQRYLKVLLNWYCHRVPYLLKELKMKTTASCRSMFEWLSGVVCAIVVVVK